MFKKGRIAIILSALAMLSILISACGSTTATTPAATAQPAGPTCVKGSITFDGSSALYPLAKAVSDYYQDKCDGATITEKSSGSGQGLQSASDGTVQVGNSDIFADATKYPGLTDHQVAVVVFSVIINKDVTGVSNLTSQQITDIYTGKVTNWKEVGGNDKQIVTVSRKAGSGTRVTFDKFVMVGGATEKSDSSSLVADQSGDVASTVGSTSGAIAYISTSYAKKNTLTTIKIDGVADDDADVKTNAYKFWNIEHMFTKGEATGLAKSLIDYMKSDDAKVKDLRMQNGFIALSFMSPAALTAKQP